MAVTTRPPAAPGHVGCAARVLEYQLLLWRRTWRGSVFSGFLSPLLYLGALGYGLGSLVDQGAGTVGGASYVAFVAPGVLAAMAMQTAVGETTWPVLGAVRWQRTYHAMLATPASPGDVVAGHLGFVLVRVLVGVASFFAVAVMLRTVPSWQGLLAVPFATLTGMAFATPVYAFSARQDDATGFTLLSRFGVVPMFLFSGTFFPVAQLPGVLQPLAQVTPLWHGVELCRAATLGQLSGPATALHVAYLGLWVGLGSWAAARSLRTRLVV